MIKKIFLKTGFLAALFLLSTTIIFPQALTLDQFETSEGWEFVRSDGVRLDLANDTGYEGNAIRFEYDFTKGTGYGGIQKQFPLDLPENYEFSFYIRADSPPNNFEIKFIDSTGNNVWWVNNRNYDFPGEWTMVRIKKRHISFAWGPSTDKELKRIDRIEFTIASFVGGKGTVWIDNLNFKPLLPERETYPLPVIGASSSLKDHPTGYMSDHSDETYWLSDGIKGQYILIDFTTRREFGGIQIKWLKDHQAGSFEILVSDNARDWETVYSVKSNKGETSFIRLPETEANNLRIDLLNSGSEKGFGIVEIAFLDIENSMTLNDFLVYAAENSPIGNYPRYFSNQGTYWTITGVNNDVKEALINEDGMVEVDKGMFSLEPMIKIGDSLFNWSNVKAMQNLGAIGNSADFSFLPSVEWDCNDLKFLTEVASFGEANVNSNLLVSYAFENLSGHTMDFEFYVLIRPCQVNPFYQFLNFPGGVGKIESISEEENGVIKVDDKNIFSGREYSSFGAGIFDEGNLVSMIRNGDLPQARSAFDREGLANGVIHYAIKLDAGEHDRFFIEIPFYANSSKSRDFVSKDALDEFNEVVDFWKSKVDHIKFNLPSSADRIVKTYKANLVYILINRDNAGIQPGSRSYERSWIRDGSLTSSALLKSGIVQEVRDFIDWYSDYQYESGKVPCVVDFRGPDPVPEHDSHGELIYLIREYFNFTRDTAFLRSKNEHVLGAVDYIEYLVAQRSIDYYKYGNDSLRAFYGLVPESISHEGYSDKPMHSYWDNFFTLKGLKDAAEIQKILGNVGSYERISAIRDTFRQNLYNSLQLAMKIQDIDYIPGCVELGDFDATSTTIALTPCNELDNLPKPQVYNTFDKYYEYFKKRKDDKIEWINYTPYENRLIGSFIILDQPEKAHELIKFFLDDQRPQGWYHWAEVVWKDYRMPRFIGDMPHTWVGSDFINAIRTMFVYENEYDKSLVLAAGLYQDWIDAGDGMSVENLPTYYGEISYSIMKEEDHYIFNIYGDAELPENGISIRNFNGSRLPRKVLLNGSEISSYSENEISVNEIPADLVIYY